MSTLTPILSWLIATATALISGAVAVVVPTPPVKPPLVTVVARHVAPTRSEVRKPAPVVHGPTSFEWAELRNCESGGDYATNTGNDYYGAYQFDLSTWHSNGGVGLPSDAAPAVQDAEAQLLYSRRGNAPWPVCGRYLP